MADETKPIPAIADYPPLPEFDVREDRKVISRACREWANLHPAATCQSDKDILSYISFLQCLDYEELGGAYVSYKRIAAKVGKSKRAVIYRIKRLVDLGAIQREKRLHSEGDMDSNLLTVPQIGLEWGSEIVAPGVVKNDADNCTRVVKPLHQGSEILEGELHQGSEIVAPPVVKSCTTLCAHVRTEYSDLSISDSNKSESIKANGSKARRTIKNHLSAPETDKKPVYKKPEPRPGESQQEYDLRCQRDHEQYKRLTAQY